MQRLFSTFPGGVPGVGLLLLRAVVGGWSILHGGIPAIAAGGLLAIGFLTPLAAGLSVAILGFSDARWLVSLALALLGPGAFSLDARLFGRREIIIPRRSNPSGV